MTSTTPISPHPGPLPLSATGTVGLRPAWAPLIDVAAMLFVFAVIFGVYTIGRSWLGPAAPGAHISQNRRALPLYALYSLVRIGVAHAQPLGTFDTWRQALPITLLHATKP